MSGIELRGVGKSYGGKPALRGVDLVVKAAELLVVLGPNGAGKTTLLKLVAGLVRPDGGSIVIAGRDVAGTPPERRGVSMQFQSLALFPDRSAYDNLAFPLRQSGVSAKAVDQRVRAVASRLRVDHLLGRLPSTFSGGEAQRVAIGRAIVGDSPVLLLDEPLSNIDAQLRRELRMEVRRLQRDLGRTVVYVTHDRAEALSLGDRIAVLSEGLLLQVGTPEELQRSPRHRLVAELLASPRLNVVPLDLTGIEAGKGAGEAQLAFDPAAASLHPAARERAIPVRIERLEFQGSYVTVHARLRDVPIRVVADPAFQAEPGTDVFLSVDPARCHLIDPITHRIIER